MASPDSSKIVDIPRVGGFEVYRYFLMDFMPGAGAIIVLVYYLRQYPEMREIAADYAFLAEIAGGAFLVGLILGLAFGLGLVVNVSSAIAFGSLTDGGPLPSVAAKLQLRGGLGGLEALARRVMGSANATSRVTAAGFDERAVGTAVIGDIQARLAIWLDREHPVDYQRMERYGAAAALCRSLAAIVVLTWLVEAYRILTGEGLGVASSWFPASALALAVLLFAGAYANVHRSHLTLLISRQRLHEVALPPSPDEAK
jgi:hypothetical protein